MGGVRRGLKCMRDVWHEHSVLQFDKSTSSVPEIDTEREMPEQETIKRARRDADEGKSPSTQAGEFVHQEMEHIRHGKHGARSAKQAIAIGLSEARRAGIKVKPPRKGTTSSATRRKAEKDSEAGSRTTKKRPSARRSRATKSALRREGTSAASSTALSRQGHASARKRSAGERSASARRGAATKGAAGRSAAAKKAAKTRARRAA